jgi:hypothetical protein
MQVWSAGISFRLARSGSRNKTGVLASYRMYSEIEIISGKMFKVGSAKEDALCAVQNLDGSCAGNVSVRGASAVAWPIASWWRPLPSGTP